jgi:acyl-CoA synthetase (AMP-forming)/AMP-acid ligase II
MQLGQVAPAEKVALVVGGTGAETTFGELEAAANRYRQVLTAHGLGFGDHVALLFDSRADLFPVVWAAHLMGLYYTPVNWHLTREEAAYVVDNCDARALLVAAPLADLGRSIAAEAPRLETVFSVGGPVEGMVDADAEAAAASDEPWEENWVGFAMYYSSGTTGRPKGILRDPVRVPFGTPGPIDALMNQLYGLTADSVQLSPGPLYHAAPLGWAMITQAFGGTSVIMERFDPEQTLALIERHRITHLQVVPTMLIRMLKLPPEVRARYDVSSLQAVVHAAAPCPVEVKRQVIDWFGPIVWEYYAGSEGSGYFAIDSATWLAHPGSVGRPMRGVVHILDDDGVELPVGEVGTIWFEGTGTFRYHKDDEKTATAFNDRGWTTMGDVGRLDEEGFLYLADRRADLILSGGVNIYPQEVENALARHPAVADVAVVGVPDEDLGEQVRAVVQLTPGVVAGPELLAELAQHCRQHLAGFKCPKRIDVVDQLPRLPSGKMLRRQVRDSFTASAPPTA